MKKNLMIGGGFAAALLASVGAIAVAQMPDGPPKTRAELQAKIAEHFQKADANKDGYVTQAEFDAAREAMKAKMGAMHAEHRDKMFAMLDKDGNGSISKAEFDAAPPPHPRGPDGPGPDGMGPGDGEHMGHGERGMRHGMHGGRMMFIHHAMMGGMGGEGWFERADTNKDGKLTLAEASAGPLAMFDKVDTNHDGTISPEEHKAAFAAMRAKWQARAQGDKPD